MHEGIKNVTNISWNQLNSVEKFTLTDKIFRQINSLVISLVKLLLSRNFSQKKVREHSTICNEKSKYFPSNANQRLNYELISWKIFERDRFIVHFHTHFGL